MLKGNCIYPLALFLLIMIYCATMKKILTIFAVTLFSSFAWSQVPLSYVPFYFFKHGTKLADGTVCSGITYEDGTLIENESFRVLAVFNNTDELPFQLDVEGNLIPAPGAEGAIFKWMKTSFFGNGAEQDYAPVVNGITGIVHTDPLYWVPFSLNESDIPSGYGNATYRVYFITQDTRVPEGEEKRLVKWNATYVTTCGPMFAQKYFAMNFKGGSYSQVLVASPTRDPYVEGPAVPEGTSDEVKDAAIEALEAALKDEEAYAQVEFISNPDAGAKINGLITGSGTVKLDETGTVATFTYAFGVSAISVDGSTITVTVALGEGQFFVDGVTVTLVDLEGVALKGVTDTKVEKSGESTATVTIQVDPVDPDNIGTLIFKAKAEK